MLLEITKIEKDQSTNPDKNFQIFDYLKIKIMSEIKIHKNRALRETKGTYSSLRSLCYAAKSLYDTKM